MTPSLSIATSCYLMICDAMPCYASYIVVQTNEHISQQCYAMLRDVTSWCEVEQTNHLSHAASCYVIICHAISCFVIEQANKNNSHQCYVMLCHTLSCYVVEQTHNKISQHGYVTLCHAMSCCAMPCRAMWLNKQINNSDSGIAISCYGMPCLAMSCYVMLCHTMSWHVIEQVNEPISQ